MSSGDSTADGQPGKARGAGKAIKPKRTIIGEYDVGYGKPPVGNRFPPKKSGNPRGRPRKLKLGERDIDYFLSETVLVPLDGRQVKLTKRELIDLQVVNRAAKGDDRCIRLIMSLAKKPGEHDDSLAAMLRFDPALTQEILDAVREEVKADSKGATDKGAQTPAPSVKKRSE